MIGTRVLGWVALVVCVVCLVWGYVQYGYWQILIWLMLVALFWGFTKKHMVMLASSGVLVGAVGASAAGITLGLSPWMMLMGVLMSLVFWDVAQFDAGLTDLYPDLGGPRLHRMHFRSLGIVLTTSIPLVWLSTQLNLRLPFGILALLVLASIGGVGYLSCKSKEQDIQAGN